MFHALTYIAPPSKPDRVLADAATGPLVSQAMTVLDHVMPCAGQRPFPSMSVQAAYVAAEVAYDVFLDSDLH